jgi:hypothetical protein
MNTSPIEKKKRELSALRRKAFQAQRDGDLRKYGKISSEAEVLEDEIVELISENT